MNILFISLSQKQDYISLSVVDRLVFIFQFNFSEVTWCSSGPFSYCWNLIYLLCFGSFSLMYQNCTYFIKRMR